MDDLIEKIELNKKPVKCVIWDLDNTIWTGILSEQDDLKLKDGIEQLIDQLDKMGILQSIASRNDASDALDMLKKLNLEQYFVYPQINWGPKSSSIEKIQKSLNISADTFIFVDDQILERDEVNSKFPEVTCIDALEYESILSLPRIANMEVSDDAKLRRQRYQDDILRKEEEETFVGASEEFLSQLDMKFYISKAEPEDLLRAEELTQRTNQLNSTGITYSREQLSQLMNSEEYALFVFELVDKYGSYGKIGLALVHYKDNTDYIKLLLMSCRTLSRGVGSIALTFIMQQAKERGCKLHAEFKRTPRNRQMFVTYQFSGFKEIEKHPDDTIIFYNDLEQVPDLPHYVDVIIK
ncbi:HAD-IIIC family phosphatase [Xenorhabdus bovienii]|uniref:Methoxymalonate biosynthesis protein involved in xenocoumacin synthesis n=2 Tax=Xenorhabdus bovienii TaxID=40576 RepID=A0A077PMA4_XENBV|nr:HAD-IIIC family phosphatase [Xenorhabdus bovienii]MDE9542005.1 HAD-IIIC family phosphatase [Xenorhabdus bovienii]CDH20894.1 Methoxymalonate biosynthesis protein involved in xenocoumacin synthesis [Xenorhabdus bovienii str. kraussei Quebec]CDH32261.1 Methoxymalonate biosynthesis protein involved in xenocoumacin synthesis [Xenorhabdus bovienii str. Intermedium]